MIEVITPPSPELLLLAEAKAHLRIETNDSDAWLTSRIVAAREYVEHETGRSFGTQTLRMTLPVFADAVALERPPIVSVSSVTYLDAAGVRQTVPAPTYYLDRSEPVTPVLRRAISAQWPVTGDQIGGVEINYVAGTWGARPEAAIEFMLLLLGTMFENREADAERAAQRLQFADRLLDRYRVPRA
jgi:uncharacterized phiE125 gp8 family phage protein